MTPTSSSQAPQDEDGCWRQATRLRAAHGGWVVIWLAPRNCFRAYRRMPGARRDTALSAATAEEMADLIAQAEQGISNPAHHARDSR